MEFNTVYSNGVGSWGGKFIRMVGVSIITNRDDGNLTKKKKKNAIEA